MNARGLSDATPARKQPLFGNFSGKSFKYYRSERQGKAVLVSPNRNLSPGPLSACFRLQRPYFRTGYFGRGGRGL